MAINEGNTLMETSVEITRRPGDTVKTDDVWFRVNQS